MSSAVRKRTLRPRTLLIGASLVLVLLAAVAWGGRQEILYARSLHRTEGSRALFTWLRDHVLGLSRSPYVWEGAEPEDEGLDGVELDGLKDDLARRGTRAFLLLKNDRIVYEWYSAESGPERPHSIAALGKAVTGGMILLLALQDERIGLEDPATRYIPQWIDDPIKSRITIGQLARHTSGLDDVRFGGKYEGWKELYRKDRDVRFPMVLSTVPVIFDPDSRYSYSGAGYYALSYALSSSLKSASQPSLKTMLTERLMDPLGIPRTSWHMGYGDVYELDGLRLYAIGSGGSYSARAVARLGQFMLHRGRWNGQQIVSPELVDALLTANQPPPSWAFDDAEPAPAFGWWVNSDGFWPAVPKDACIGAGMGHQVLLVIPSLDLVAVRMGGALEEPRKWGPEYWDALGEHFLEPLMRAIGVIPLAGPVTASANEGSEPLKGTDRP